MNTLYMWQTVKTSQILPWLNSGKQPKLMKNKVWTKCLSASNCFEISSLRKSSYTVFSENYMECFHLGYFITLPWPSACKDDTRYRDSLTNTVVNAVRMHKNLK